MSGIPGDPDSAQPASDQFSSSERAPASSQSSARLEYPADDTIPGPQPPVAVLVTAAGSSTRYGPGKKEFERIGGRSVLSMSISPFLSLDSLSALVITAPPGRLGELRESLDADITAATDAMAFRIVPGGATRRDSVLSGLEALVDLLRSSGIDPESAIVLIHDGARPWVSRSLVQRVADTSIRSGACIPVVPLADTPKELSQDGTISGHPRRSGLGGAQTPQGFRLAAILDIHRQAAADSVECTDDAELWSRYRGPVSWVEGEPDNRKITYRGDIPDYLRNFERDSSEETGQKKTDSGRAAPACALRIGEGWDLHRLVPGRRLMVGGIALESPLGEDAHSDGDVLLHAVIDALIGACALGDIGSHFPPEDMRWKDADSAVLVAEVSALVRRAGYCPVNLDCTVILETPRIGPHREAIRRRIAELLGMDQDTVSVKAKTHEKVDAVGELRAVEARAVILVAKNR